MTTNMKSKGKQLVVSSEESNIEWYLGLKDVLVEPEGVYQHTRTHIGTIASVYYSLFGKKFEAGNEHSAIIESQSLNSSSETTTFAYMAEAPEEVARQFEEQAQV